MADFTTPQFVLQRTIATGLQMKLHFDDATTKTLTLVSSVTRRPDRTGVSSSDIWTWLAAAIEAQDDVTASSDATPAGDETWTASEASGSFKGRLVLTNDHPRADGKTLDSVEFLTPTILSGADMGFSSDDITAVADATGDYAVTAPWMTQGLYIPHNTEQILLAVDEATPRDAITQSLSPTGNLVQDFYGRMSTRQVALLTVNAASVWPHYAADADYLNDDQTIDDPNCSWESFRQYWVSLTDSARTCRFSRDIAAPATYADVLPLLPWFSNTREAASVASESPLMYDLTLEFLEA